MVSGWVVSGAAADHLQRGVAGGAGRQRGQRSGCGRLGEPCPSPSALPPHLSQTDCHVFCCSSQGPWSQASLLLPEAPAKQSPGSAHSVSRAFTHLPRHGGCRGCCPLARPPRPLTARPCLLPLLLGAILRAVLVFKNHVRNGFTLSRPTESFRCPFE